MTNVKKQYDFISAQRLGDNSTTINGAEAFSAFATVVGFVSKEPIVRKMTNGHKVAEITFALKNTGKKLTGALGVAPAEETLWLNATAFDNDNFKLATRLEKAVRKGMRIAVSGVVKPTEYQGKVQYQMVIADFDIIWSSEKGPSFNNTYTWVSARGNGEGKPAIVSFRGRIAKEPEIKVTPTGKDVMSFKVPLNKVGSKLNHSLGIKEKFEGDTCWLQVNVWNNEGFNLKDRAEKILKQGSILVGQGTVTTSTNDDGTVFYNMNLSEFEITNSKQNAKDENTTSDSDHSNYSSQQSEDPFENGGTDIEEGSFLDDDIPF